MIRTTVQVGCELPVAEHDECHRPSLRLPDSVAQRLYSIRLGARTARLLVDHDPERAIEALEYVLTEAEAGLLDCMAHIRCFHAESVKETQKLKDRPC